MRTSVAPLKSPPDEGPGGSGAETQKRRGKPRTLKTEQARAYPDHREALIRARDGDNPPRGTDCATMHFAEHDHDETPRTLREIANTGCFPIMQSRAFYALMRSAVASPRRKEGMRHGLSVYHDKGDRRYAGRFP